MNSTTIHIQTGASRKSVTFATYQHAMQWLSRGKRVARLLAIITMGESHV